MAEENLCCLINTEFACTGTCGVKWCNHHLKQTRDHRKYLGRNGRGVYFDVSIDRKLLWTDEQKRRYPKSQRVQAQIASNYRCRKCSGMIVKMSKLRDAVEYQTKRWLERREKEVEGRVYVRKLLTIGARRGWFKSLTEAKSLLQMVKSHTSAMTKESYIRVLRLLANEHPVKKINRYFNAGGNWRQRGKDLEFKYDKRWATK